MTDNLAPITLRRVPTTHSDAQTLLHALEQAQRQLYNSVDSHVKPEDFEERHGGLFVVAYLDGVPVGCGGVRKMCATRAEIRKMYVSSVWRGYGVGRRILACLEQAAVEYRAVKILLETGSRNLAALGLYEAAGYVSRPPYVEGRRPEINRAYEKTLR